MSWGYYDYKPVSKTKADSAKALEKLKKINPNISPVIIEGRKIANTWWGSAWNNNLESYADYSNRIERGKAYVKSGMVLDLQIKTGVVTGLVQGSRKSPYHITVKIDKMPSNKWNKIVELCSHRIADMAELVEGKFPNELAELFLRQGQGLFPSPKEIHFDCSCPDWADMCKHVAAVLYGIGARFDNDPMLFFKLRDVDFTELLKKSIDEKIDSMLKNADKKSKRVIDDADISELFGV